jgi:hypothetical protein
MHAHAHRVLEIELKLKSSMDRVDLTLITKEVKETWYGMRRIKQEYI